MIVQPVLFPDPVKNNQRQTFHLGHMLVIILIIFPYMVDEAHFFLFQHVGVILVFLTDDPQ